MADFEIRIGPKSGDGYPVIARATDGASTSGFFQEPFAERELSPLLAMLKSVYRDGSGGALSAQAEIGAALESLGVALYESIFDERILDAYQQALERQQGVLRCKLIIPQTELARLPWEYLHDGQRFLGLNLDTPIVRGVIAHSWYRQPVTPLRLLILGACPLDQAPLEIATEYKLIEQELECLAQSGHIKLDRLWGPDIARNLPQYLLELAPHVLHFAGHGTLDSLLLEDGAGNSRAMSGTSLRDLLGNIKSLQLVVLNACEMAGISQGRQRLNVAARLVQVGVPMAVGMQYPISDAAALAFSEGFYEALAQQMPLDAATTWARVRISYYLACQDQDSTEWGTPAVYVAAEPLKVNWGEVMAQALSSRLREPASIRLPKRLIGRDGKEMCLIPAGSFAMGSAVGPVDEMPQHQVDLPAYWIDAYPVTNAEYARFVQATGHKPPAHWLGGDYAPDRAQHPVVNVSWQDAQAYAAWAGKRLPSEAEWEKAARGSDGRLWPWGNVFHPSHANTREAGEGDTMPVEVHPLGASVYGVMDQSGNVWEWTADLYRPYPGSAHHHPSYEEPVRVLRGGSWSYGAEYARCAARTFDFADFVFERYGFRCVVDIDMTVALGEKRKTEA